jgi:hypothetical protein
MRFEPGSNWAINHWLPRLKTWQKQKSHVPFINLMEMETTHNLDVLSLYIFIYILSQSIHENLNQIFQMDSFWLGKWQVQPQVANASSTQLGLCCIFHSWSGFNRSWAHNVKHKGHPKSGRKCKNLCSKGKCMMPN